MAEGNNSSQSLPPLDNVRDYSLLHSYVKAYLDICSKEGEVWEKLRTVAPDFESKYDLSKVSGIISLMEKYQNVLGLEGVNKNKLKQIHTYASTMAQNLNKNFPTLVDVDNAKAKYDEHMHRRDIETSQKVVEDKEALKLAKKENGKKRWKIAGATLAAVAGTVLTGGILGGFGLGVYGLIANAVTLGAGITSGLAVGGLVVGIVGGRLLLKGAAAMFSKIGKLVRTAFSEHKATRQKVRELRKSLRRSKAQRRLAERALAFDRAYDAVPYPGNSLFNAAEYDNNRGVNPENMETLSVDQARELTGRERGAAQPGPGREGTGAEHEEAGEHETQKGNVNKEEGAEERTTNTGTSGSNGNQTERDDEEEFELQPGMTAMQLYDDLVDLEAEESALTERLGSTQAGTPAYVAVQNAIEQNHKKQDKYTAALNDQNIVNPADKNNKKRLALKTKILEDTDYVGKAPAYDEALLARASEADLAAEKAKAEKAAKKIQEKLDDESFNCSVIEFRNLVAQRNAANQYIIALEKQQTANEAYEEMKYGPFGEALRRRLASFSDKAIENYQETDADSLQKIIESVIKTAPDGESVLTAMPLENLAGAAATVGMAGMLQAYAEEILLERKRLAALSTDELFGERNAELKAMREAQKAKAEWDAKKEAEGKTELSEEEEKEERRIYIAAEKHQVEYESRKAVLDERDITKTISVEMANDASLIDDAEYIAKREAEKEQEKAEIEKEAEFEVDERIKAKKEALEAAKAIIAKEAGVEFGKFEYAHIEVKHIPEEIAELEKAKEEKAKKKAERAIELQNEAEEKKKADLKAKKEKLQQTLSRDVLKSAFIAKFKDEKGNLIKDGLLQSRKEMIEEQLAVLQEAKLAGLLKEEDIDEALVAEIVDEFIDETKEFKGNWQETIEKEQEKEAEEKAKGEEASEESAEGEEKKEGTETGGSGGGKKKEDKNKVKTEEDEEEQGEAVETEANPEETKEKPNVAIAVDPEDYKVIGMPPEQFVHLVFAEDRDVTEEEAKQLLGMIESGEYPADFEASEDPKVRELLDKVRINLVGRPNEIGVSIENSVKAYDEAEKENGENEAELKELQAEAQEWRDLAVADGLLGEESKNDTHHIPVAQDEEAQKAGYPSQEEVNENRKQVAKLWTKIYLYDKSITHVDKDGQEHKGSKEELLAAVEELKGYLKSKIKEVEAENTQAEEEEQSEQTEKEQEPTEKKTEEKTEGKGTKNKGKSSKKGQTQSEAESEENEAEIQDPEEETETKAEVASAEESTSKDKPGIGAYESKRMSISEEGFIYHTDKTSFVIPVEKMKKLDDDIEKMLERGWKETQIIERIAGQYKRKFKFVNSKGRFVQGQDKFALVVKSHKDRKAYLAELEAQGGESPLLDAYYHKQKAVEEVQAEKTGVENEFAAMSLAEAKDKEKAELAEKEAEEKRLAEEAQAKEKAELAEKEAEEKRLAEEAQAKEKAELAEKEAEEKRLAEEAQAEVDLAKKEAEEKRPVKEANEVEEVSQKEQEASDAVRSQGIVHENEKDDKYLIAEQQIGEFYANGGELTDEEFADVVSKSGLTPDQVERLMGYHNHLRNKASQNPSQDGGEDELGEE